MSKKRVDAAKAKEQRKKKIVIGLAVLFAAMMAFQLPKLMKGSAAPVADPAPTSTSQADPAGGVVPADGAQPVAVVSSSEVAADPDPAPTPQEGQLVAFDRFKSKDPFVQQLDPQAGAASTSPAATGSNPAPDPDTTPAPSPTPAPAITPAPEATPPPTEPSASAIPVAPAPTPEPPVTVPVEPTPVPVPEAPVTPPAPPATPPAPPVTPPAPTPPSAPPVTPAQPPPSAPAPVEVTISVNGTSEQVSVGASFPQSEPLFRLVSVKDDVARLSIAGGSLQDGAPTVALGKSKPLTLMNTADGTRYVLRLL